MSHHHDVCDTCLKVLCRCNDTPVQPQPTPGALTREDVVGICLDFYGDLPTVEQRNAIVQLRDTDAALRATITQQAKELEQAKGNYAIQKAAADDYEQQLAAVTTERDAARGRIQIADKRATLHPSWHEKDKPALLDALAFQGGMTKVLLDETDELRQQLAASQARCREMETVRHDYKATLTDAELSDKEYMTAYCSDFHADYGLALKRLAQLQATLAAREAQP